MSVRLSTALSRHHSVHTHEDEQQDHGYRDDQQANHHPLQEIWFAWLLVSHNDSSFSLETPLVLERAGAYITGRGPANRSNGQLPLPTV